MFLARATQQRAPNNESKAQSPNIPTGFRRQLLYIRTLGNDITAHWFVFSFSFNLLLVGISG
jgi:hypothetical protein